MLAPFCRTLVCSALINIPIGATAATTFEDAHAWALEASERELVAALADDDIRWNAQAALWELMGRGAAVIPELEGALGSRDWQQRQLAAAALRRIKGYVPSERMLVVCVEGLADDALPWGESPRTFTHVPNAYGSVEYLIRYTAAAEGFIAAGLHSGDAQQRFFCAYALGMAGRSGYAELICDVLAPHLNDNDLRGDAVLAVRALYLTGDAVAPFLRDAWREADAQGRRAIELVLLDLRDPPQTVAEMRERGAASGLTERGVDPAMGAGSVWGVEPFRVGR